MPNRKRPALVKGNTVITDPFEALSITSQALQRQLNNLDMRLMSFFQAIVEKDPSIGQRASEIKMEMLAYHMQDVLFDLQDAPIPDFEVIQRQKDAISKMRKDAEEHGLVEHFDKGVEERMAEARFVVEEVKEDGQTSEF